MPSIVILLMLLLMACSSASGATQAKAADERKEPQPEPVKEPVEQVSATKTPVQSEAEAQAEREHLLASNDVEQWKQLISKYPGTVQATAAAWRMQTRGSICAEYVGGAPYNFSEYLVFEEKLFEEILMRLASYEPSQGGLPLMVIAGAALPLLESKQKSLEETCQRIEGHGNLQGEEPVKESMRDDCERLKSRFQRISNTLVPSSVKDNIVVNMTERLPRMTKETLSLTKSMMASAAKRQAACKKLGAPASNNAKDPG